ncbi:SigE family RNA polymerase sigma factor [Oryzihumus leptocrescens]|uniref:RNA polymerase sigma-70 factor (Sigma-E family) n=1 Tax=Oryzihumus leptocrescens TaxID=297536 RepID=A0A542ZMP4_9MICO|nr:SigE family RNA polymerase sigma factor [Oryzihumus leptocrescens]TQL61480.1 RNA polymerase sigma-70 factor (sigma-E family) [Oryzihumus leptocrescens]
MGHLARERADAEFADFVRSAGPRLLQTARLLTGDEHRAEELLQDALVRTYAAWSRVRRDDAAAYVRRAMLNQRTDTWRRRRREVLTDDAPEPAAHLAATRGHDPADVAADADEVRQALQALTRRERTVLVLRHYVGLPVEAVAEELGVSTGTVKSTSSRAIARLREVLDDQARPDPDHRLAEQRS